ncbi:MAG: PIN domain-containing protein [Bosea sp. (in: a-proteobacteria)]
MAFTAFFDANVLYGSAVRSLLVELARTDLFRAKWSHQVHDEWLRNLKTNRPDLDPAKLDMVRDLMIASVPDSIVVGYEPLIETLKLPDPDDRHVLAAAIKGRADVIVTFNLRHFPADVLRPYGIHAETPDEFIMHLESLERSTVVHAAVIDRARYKKPLLSPDDYLDHLAKGGLNEVVAFLASVKVLLK